MTSQVTATVVVNFDQSGGGQLTAEVDGRSGGFNAGLTTFVAGGPGLTGKPAFLVYKSSDVTIDDIETSADDVGATIEPLGGGTILESMDLQFADVAEATIGKPFYHSFTFKWLGNNLGTPTPREDKVTIPTAGVGVLRITYKTLFEAYRVNGIPSPMNGETTFPVLIVVSGTKA